MTKKNSAFTLLEIVLYVFIFVIIGLAVYSFTSVAFRVNAYSQSVAEIDAQGAAIMQKIIRYINNANYYDGINYPVLGASSSSLSLKTSVATTTPTVISLSNNAIVVKEGNYPVQSITSNRVKVTNLLFNNFGADMTDGVVKISFTLEINSNSGLTDFDYKQNFVSAANPLRR